MKKFFLLASFVAYSVFVFAQNISFNRVEPPFWWTDMKSSQLQILFYNSKEDLSQYDVVIQQIGIELKKRFTVENPHYIFLNLELSKDLKPGQINIQFKSKKKNFTYKYEFKPKPTSDKIAQGFNSSDVVYLIMPDRFANGDVKNDTITGMFEGTHRDKPYGRHGGDLKGISDHVDYFQKLGVTALWLNPVLENNQRQASYHGYAITDLYKVDRRFGSNEEYVALINKLHGLGVKMIQDMVMNHIGDEHWLVKDPPQKDWIHQFPTYTTSNYRGGVISDPYHSKADSIKMLNGWFDKAMPDVNQSNPLFAQYLIQNSLWWIGYAGIDGIRMDTYPYPDKNFMAQWTKALTDEYPNFGLVGEVWLTSPSAVAYWQKGAKNKDGYESGLQSVTDFPFCFSIPKALNEEAGWETGLARIYDMLSQDFIYPDANNNLTFLDNHDMTRFFLSVGRDVNKMKMALTLLLTTRGIPQIYYGTEALMDGDGAVHPDIRKDFPGGWPGDHVNFFEGKNLTKDQRDISEFLAKLLKWRKSNEVIHTGKLVHFIPENNVYVYFKKLGSKSVMVILNNSDREVELNSDRYRECLSNFSSATEVNTGQVFLDGSIIKIRARQSLILEMR